MAPALAHLRTVHKTRTDVLIGMLVPIALKLQKLCEQETPTPEPQLKDLLVTFKMTKAYDGHPKDFLWVAWSTFFRKSVSGRTREEAIANVLAQGPAILVEDLDASEPIVVMEADVRIRRSEPGLRLVTGSSSN